MPSADIVGTRLNQDYATPNASAGTKTDTPLMETPVNVQVIPQRLLTDQGATTLEQALTNVSGVVSYGNGGDIQDTIIRGFDTGQVLFLDGVRIYDHLGNGLLTLAGVDHIEVVKGPAAVLYGETEPGGFVNVVTKDPQPIPYYAFEQSVGSWKHSITRFDATGPLDAERAVQYRLDGSYETGDSWRDGIWSKSGFIAPSLAWVVTPRDRLTVKYFFDHNPMIPDNGQNVPLLADGTLVNIPRHVNLYDPSGVWQRNDISRTKVDYVHAFNDEWQVKGQVTHYSAKSSGLFVNGQSFIPPGTPGNVGSDWNFQLGYPIYGSGMAGTQNSNERTKAASVDLTGQFDTMGARHSVLVGSDFSKYDEPTAYVGGVPTNTPIVPVDYTSSEPALLDPNSLSQSNQQIYDAGFYAQDQIKLGRFDVLLGLRYQAWHQDSLSLLQYGSTNVANGTAFYLPATAYHQSAVTPRAGIVWEAKSWLSVYALYADGFFPNSGFDFQHQTLKATGANDKEIGLKYQSADKKLQATLGWYDLVKTKVPSADLVHFDPLTHQFDFQTTIGAERSRGVEFDLQGQILPNWSMILTYAYTNAKVTADSNSTATTGIASTLGNRLGATPMNAASFWTTYDLLALDSGRWTIGGGIVAREATLDLTNTFTTPGYHIVNLMTRYAARIRGVTLSAQLNVDNAFNKAYFANGYYDYGAAGTGAFAGVKYGDPRAYMATLRLEY
ncbi:MAG TPA: TonB-dependent siderophore receptor [Burkholderiaceae bacterium]|nr:TonB-dependent siderophore receptor [Burkholderiaceae bacterium]